MSYQLAIIYWEGVKNLIKNPFGSQYISNSFKALGKQFIDIIRSLQSERIIRTIYHIDTANIVSRSLVYLT